MDTELRYEVLNCKKFFFAKLAWGYNENTVFHDDDNSKLNTLKWLPLIKIDNDTKNSNVHLEYVVQPHAYTHCVLNGSIRGMRATIVQTPCSTKNLKNTTLFYPTHMGELNKHLGKQR